VDAGAVLGLPGDDGADDGVREDLASSPAWAASSIASCHGGKERLEIDGAAVCFGAGCRLRSAMIRTSQKVRRVRQSETERIGRRGVARAHRRWRNSAGRVAGAAEFGEKFCDGQSIFPREIKGR
jgi:hypothetical protein